MLMASVTHSRWPALSALLLFFGFGIVALIIIHPAHEKIAIVGSTFGILSILVGVWLLDDQSSFPLTLSKPWLRFLPLLIGISVNLLASLASPAMSAFALAAALTCIFPLSRVINGSKVYVAFLAVFLAASIGYNVYFYYPLVTRIDSCRYLSVASAIVQRGHYSDIIQPTDSYYFPFPVMSIAPSVLSSVTGLNLELSLLLFPGSLIVLQPLLVFLLSRLVFHDVNAAALSAMIVVAESAVISMISGPLAQSTAISLLLLFLMLLFSGVRSRAHTITAFVIFLMLTAIHGAVGLVSAVLVTFLIVRERSSYRRLILPLVVIYLGYITITEAIDSVARNAQISVESILEWIFTPTLRTGSELYGPGSNGLIFIWWGLPVSLALFSILVQRCKQNGSWAYAGLGLLGLSFAVNLVAPSLVMDRYGGLTAWLILAMTGGKALRTLVRNSRQLLMLAPVILLVCVSAIVDPSLSPQYGFYQGYRGYLPTTKFDRTALDWANGHVARIVFADSASAYYLILSRYRSGTFNQRGVVPCLPQDMPRVLGPNDARFVRPNTLITDGDGQVYQSSVPTWISQGNQITNIVYHNSRDILETNAAGT